jgi:hypothetical protein
MNALLCVQRNYLHSSNYMKARDAKTKKKTTAVNCTSDRSFFYRFSIGIDRGKETHTYDTTPALAEILLLQKKFANPPLYAHGRVRDDAIRAATVPAIASLCGSALSQQYPPQRMYTSHRFQILDAHFSKETRGHQERRQRGQCTETGN